MATATRSTISSNSPADSSTRNRVVALKPCGLETGEEAYECRLPHLCEDWWCSSLEKRQMTNIPVKVIRSIGTSQNAVADLSGEGLRLEGVEGLTVGEHALVLLPDHRVLEIVVRWSLGDQAGVRLISQ